jgi:hypothetical protein
VSCRARLPAVRLRQLLDLTIVRRDLPARIDWRCTVCGDDGVISGWQASYFDLRRTRPERARSATSEDVEITVSDEVAGALRDLQLLDTSSERMVYRARTANEGAVVLTADEEEFDELLGFVAAEANHEPNRRRRQRLDRAFTELSDALEAR